MTDAADEARSGDASVSGAGDPGSLAEIIAGLAQLPDDASAVEPALQSIAQFCAMAMPAVAYASVTALRGGGPATVAMTSDVALAVDEAQYEEGAGPCVDVVLGGGEVLSVDDMTTLVRWPGFRSVALQLGLHSSLSIALFAASGQPIAALNLYSHEAGALTPLARRLTAVYEPALAEPVPATLDHGSEQLVAGLARALEFRDVIQRAIGTLMASERLSEADAYLRLRGRAAERGQSLLDTVHETLTAATNPQNP